MGMGTSPSLSRKDEKNMQYEQFQKLLNRAMDNFGKDAPVPMIFIELALEAYEKTGIDLTELA